MKPINCKTTHRKLLLLAFLLCNVFYAYAADYYCDFSVNGIYYQFIPGKTNEVAVSYDNYETGRYGGNWTNYKGNITVPAAVVYNSVTYKVTAVSSHAFSECSVTSVSLPNTITSIGAAAFLDCTQLYSITLPQSVVSIGTSAFSGCVALGSVSLPNALTSIGANSFQGCQKLTSISIPSGVQSIGENAFSGCYNLRNITFSNSNTINSVGRNAFYGTAWYDYLPNGLIYIGNVAYKYKGSIVDNPNIVLKEGTTEISEGAFQSCSGLKSISIPESVTTIGNSAFYGCAELAEITIPQNVTSVGSAFTGCSGLKTITILCPTVGQWFRQLPSVQHVILGDAVTNIANYAFQGCNGLKTINLPEGLESIGSYAFSGCGEIASVIIPKKVAIIGDYAYQGCSSLASVSIGNDNTLIGYKAFDGTEWYNSQNDGVVYIGKIAYSYKGTMPSNTDVILREGTKSLAAGVFSDCVGLSSVIIPESVTSIGKSSFEGCLSLKSVLLPSLLTSIEEKTFSGCSDLASISIPSNVSSIGSSAFYGCSNLKTIAIPEGVTKIEPSTFKGCTALSSVTLPISLASIGLYSFQGCVSLASITIPRNVESIGGLAFEGCTLTTVKVEMDEPVDILTSVFSYQSNYTYISYTNNATLYVPVGSKTAYEKAEVWKTFKDISEYVLPTDVSYLLDAVYIEPFCARIGGDAKVAICLKNAQKASAYNFDLVLPEGVTIAKDSNGKYIDALSNRHDDHTRTFNYKGDNTYSFATLSGNSEALTGNDGAIRLVTLHVADNMAEGSYPIEIRNASYSLTDGTLHSLENTTTSITVENYLLGDVNGNNGVDIGDAVTIVNYLVGKPTTTFVEKAADTNKNNQVDIGDAVTIVNYLVGKTASLSRKATDGGKEPQ